MKKTKTFKIGEYCAGGIVKIALNENEVKIAIIDWKSKEILFSNYYSKNNLSEIYAFLNEFTTYYYTDLICQYIKNN